MRAAFGWWSPSFGGTQQAFVNTYNGMAEAGIDAGVYPRPIVDRMVEDADGMDFVFVPYAYEPDIVERLSERTHVHLQVGGYGSGDASLVRESVDAADTVSVLDPHLAYAFRISDEPWVPNPPNFGMFGRTDPGEYVLVPKQDEGGGLGSAGPMAEESDLPFVVLGGSFPDPPENVTIKPPVPLSWMPEMYEGAAAVLNPSTLDGLPNVAYEAFLTATPYVAVHPEGIGASQLLEEPPVDHIGGPCSDVPAYPYGDHWVRDLADADESVGEAGRRWADSWRDTGWGWREKFETIADMVSG